MFTGIIEQTGEVIDLNRTGTNLEIKVKSLLSKELSIDQSLAHNGVCLTVIEKNLENHTVIAIEETLSKTNLSYLRPGMMINLERALMLSDRLDGHFVQGHIDTVAAILSISEKEGSWLIEIQLTPKHKHLIIDKGSIGVNGISLTVCQIKDDSFKVAIIPYTWMHTNLSALKTGDLVNLEFDLLAKYFDRWRALMKAIPY